MDFVSETHFSHVCLQSETHFKQIQIYHTFSIFSVMSCVTDDPLEIICRRMKAHRYSRADVIHNTTSTDFQTDSLLWEILWLHMQDPFTVKLLFYPDSVKTFKCDLHRKLYMTLNLLLLR